MIKLNNQPNQGFANQDQTFTDNQTNQFQSQPNQAFNQSAGFNQASQNQLNNQLAPKGFFKIPENLLQWIPWIPISLEMLTGQKIPPIGVMADILSGIQQIQFSLQQVLNQQQQIWNKLNNLENSASQQLNNLSQQVANTNQDFKILATETKKSLEFHGKDLESARKFIPRPQSEPEQINEYQ